jgi:hypothetical protein
LEGHPSVCEIARTHPKTSTAAIAPFITLTQSQFDSAFSTVENKLPGKNKRHFFVVFLAGGHCCTGKGILSVTDVCFCGGRFSFIFK